MGDMGVHIGGSKRITIENFILDKSWMMAAHFRIKCDSSQFPSDSGDFFTQLSSKEGTQYTIRVTPDVTLRQLNVVSYDKSRTVSTENRMTSPDNSECSWFKVLLGVKAYLADSTVEVGTPHLIQSLYLDNPYF